MYEISHQKKPMPQIYISKGSYNVAEICDTVRIYQPNIIKMSKLKKLDN